jgi:hypothetical protein
MEIARLESADPGRKRATVGQTLAETFSIIPDETAALVAT